MEEPWSSTATGLSWQDCSRSLEAHCIYFYTGWFKVVEAEKSLPTAFNGFWYELKEKTQQND